MSNISFSSRLNDRILFCRGKRIDLENELKIISEQYPDWLEYYGVGTAAVASMANPLSSLIILFPWTYIRRGQSERLVGKARELRSAYVRLGQMVRAAIAERDRLKERRQQRIVNVLNGLLEHAKREGDESYKVLESWEKSDLGKSNPQSVPRWVAYLFPLRATHVAERTVEESRPVIEGVPRQNVIPMQIKTSSAPNVHHRQTMSDRTS